MGGKICLSLMDAPEANQVDLSNIRNKIDPSFFLVKHHFSPSLGPFYLGLNTATGESLLLARFSAQVESKVQKELERLKESHPPSSLKIISFSHQNEDSYIVACEPILSTLRDSFQSKKVEGKPFHETVLLEIAHSLTSYLLGVAASLSDQRYRWRHPYVYCSLEAFNGQHSTDSGQEDSCDRLVVLRAGPLRTHEESVEVLLPLPRSLSANQSRRLSIGRRDPPRPSEGP